VKVLDLGEDIAGWAVAYGMRGEFVDGLDRFDVYEKAGKAIAAARAGEGPTLLECKTYRFYGHHEGDKQGYRSQEEVEEYRKNQQYCGDRNRPRETNGMSSGHDPEWPGQYVTWRCDGSQWQAISYTPVFTPPAKPQEHIARNWIEALVRAGSFAVLSPPRKDVCVGGWSHTITHGVVLVTWANGVSESTSFPFLSTYPHWVGQTITARNPDYDSDACKARRLEEARAAALEQRKEEWRVNGVPAPYCEVRTFVPPVPSNSDDLEDSQKQTRYYVAHVIPNAATGELDARTLVNHSGTALHWNGTAEGNLWSSDVYFDQGAVISKLAELSVLPDPPTPAARTTVIDCSRSSHDDVIPQNVIDHSG